MNTTHKVDPDQPYGKLSKEVRAEMERMGKIQGMEPREVEQQCNDAQLAIHGNPRPYDNNTLMRGFNRRRGA